MPEELLENFERHRADVWETYLLWLLGLVVCSRRRQARLVYLLQIFHQLAHSLNVAITPEPDLHPADCLQLRSLYPVPVRDATLQCH